MAAQPAFRLAADSPHRPDPIDPKRYAELAAEREYQRRLDERLSAQDWAADDLGVWS